MGHQALKAHQGDVRYARQDTQNVFLCRCHVEYRAGYWVENQVMTLHVVGYWRSDERPELPDPHLLVDDTWDEDERSTIAGYLDTGTYLRGFMGLSQCRLCSRDNGSGEFTDGTLVWPEGLAHYIRDHAVRLPRGVEEHILGASARLEAERVSSDWWLAGAIGPKP